MSLVEGAKALGIPVNTLRSRFKAGKIRGERDNRDKLWVWIDPSKEVSKVSASKPSKRVRSDGELEALKGHIETLQVQLTAADARAADWQAKAEAAQAEVLELWQRIAGEQRPRTWWDRVLRR